MKNSAIGLLMITFLLLISSSIFAQQNLKDPKTQKKERKLARNADWTNFRDLDQQGINVFEPQKEATTAIDHVKFRIGAGFTQQFQSLKHESSNPTLLYPRLAPGFAVAQANLYTNFMLTEGIQLNLTTYLSSRHHNEAWVKGGFIQFDKLPFKGEGWSRLMEKVRIKVGHMEVNYGDQHFRRSDGGNTLYNPFVENYIMDAFATEVAGEVEYHGGPVMGMVGISNGLINGGFQKPIYTAGGTSVEYKRGPSIYAKLAYDQKIDNDLRVRLAGSVYHNNNDGRSTLYGGDRTGSNYYYVMEGPTATSSANAFSGRFNPSFTNQISALQFNGLLEAYGFELFTTYETSKGRTIAEKQNKLDKRNANQFAVDAIYRVGPSKNVFFGLRYNSLSGQLVANNTNDQKISRVAIGGGWFLTKQVLLKGEYVTQKYNDFLGTAASPSVLTGGKFNGIVLQAVVGF